MFRIEFYCDDKHVAAALRRLVGISHGQPFVTPVVNAVAKKNGTIAAETNGPRHERLAAWLAKNKKKEVVASDVQEFCRDDGAGGYSNVILNAIAHGVLKRNGKTRSPSGRTGLKYLVVGAKP